MGSSRRRSIKTKRAQTKGASRMTEDQKSWDAIVIGSGMGGLACAAALAKTGHKALVLGAALRRRRTHSDVSPQRLSLGRGSAWAKWDPKGEARRILDWLAGGAIEFASLGAVYDIVHFPGNFEVQFPRTQ